MPTHLPPHIREKLEPIRLLVLDVDGVLTDGSLFYSGKGEEMKAFNVHDGLGIRLMIDSGIEIGVITGRSSAAVSARCSDLGLNEKLVYLGSRDKGADLDEMLSTLGIADIEMAAMGDDLPDLPVLTRAGFSFCPADAAPEIVAVCDHICGKNGGNGAVREAAEILLKASGRWTELVQKLSAPARGRR
jgi:3-deoxy-D-manno-octulosonate 8-phosphate phosphatase (KDO 8-P phosphatase)